MGNAQGSSESDQADLPAHGILGEEMDVEAMVRTLEELQRRQAERLAQLSESIERESAARLAEFERREKEVDAKRKQEGAAKQKREMEKSNVFPLHGHVQPTAQVYTSQIDNVLQRLRGPLLPKNAQSEPFVQPLLAENFHPTVSKKQEPKRRPHAIPITPPPPPPEEPRISPSLEDLLDRLRSPTSLAADRAAREETARKTDRRNRVPVAVVTGAARQEAGPTAHEKSAKMQPGPPVNKKKKGAPKPQSGPKIDVCR